MKATPLARAYEFKTSPYRHQGLEGALAHWNHEYWAWLLEMGTGKSKIAIDNGCILFELNEIDAWLILAPKGVYANWPNKEIPAHMPDRIKAKAQVHGWHGGHTKTEQAELEFLCTKRAGCLRVFVVNIEALASSKNLDKWIEKFMRSAQVYTIIDEASTIKNPAASRTKAAIRLGRMSEYRRILTGTPVPKGPLDLWAQFEFLEKSCLGHRSYYTFKHYYGIVEKKDFGTFQEPREVELVVGYRHVDKLAKELETCATIIRKEDCLDLPPKVYEEWEVELTAEQKRIYNELKQFATSELDAGKWVTATVVIAQLLRLHQITCGHVTDELGELHDLETNRPAELLKILEQVDNKTIVWCNYRRDMDRVMALLGEKGYSAVRYDGSTSEDHRAEAVWRFQGREFFTPGPHPTYGKEPPLREADIFVGTPSAGGYGITLTAARNVVYYSNNYDLEKRLQSEDRAHRIGQKFSVTYIDMVARGTIDEKIIAALKKKEQLANIIMDGPARIRNLFS